MDVKAFIMMVVTLSYAAGGEMEAGSVFHSGKWHDADDFDYALCKTGNLLLFIHSLNLINNIF